MAKRTEKTKERGQYAKWLALQDDRSDSPQAKNEYDCIKTVYDKFETARIGRQNNCYWLKQGPTDLSSNNGGSWEYWWPLQEKTWSMWYQPPSEDDFHSNVKSPMTTGRVESTLHKFKKLNFGWNAKPSTEEDRGKEKIAEVILDYIFRKSNARDAIATWVKDTLIHGSAFARVYFSKQVRMYKFPVDPTKIEDKEEKEKVTKKLEDGEVVYGKPEETVIYNDIVIEPKQIQSLYFDPQARNLHGDAFAARYVVERRIISYDDFKCEFGADPNAINVDKVHGTSYFVNYQYAFFQPPAETLNTDSVVIYEYENCIDDEHIIIANDILVKREPLPYNHKQLTYHKLDAIEFIHQFYHVGIPDFLMNIQGHQEILMNIMIDYAMRGLRQKYFIAASGFGEQTEAHLREDSDFISVDDSDHQPISSKAVPMASPPMNFEGFRLLDILDKDATLATQIDPSQMSLMPDNVPATLGVMNKEQVELMLSSLLDNFANGGMRTMGRQIWALVQQKYTIPDVKEIEGAEEGQEKLDKVWRTIRLDGLKVVEDKDSGTLDFEEDDTYDFLEIKDKYITTREDLDIYIDPDTMSILSKGLEMQKARDAYAQLMPNAVDPDDTEGIAMMKQMGRLPLYNAKKISEWYVDSQDIPEDVLIETEVATAKEVQAAKDEYADMAKGKDVTGQPGRSRAHVNVEFKILGELATQIQELFDEVQKSTQAGEQPDPHSMTLMQNMQDVAQKLFRHAMIDALPADMLDEAYGKRFQEVQDMLAPPPPPPEVAPQMPPGMDMGGVPNVGNAPNVQAMGGEIPGAQAPEGPMGEVQTAGLVQ